MYKVLLAIPPCFTNRELDFEIGFPTNLLLLGSAASSQGWQVEYLDMTLEEKEGYHSFGKLEDCLADDEIKVVGISNHTVRTSVTTRAVAEHVKLLRPDITVIVGGVNATFMWRELLDECPSIDYVLRGYAQSGLRALLQWLRDGLTDSFIPGSVTRRGNSFHVEPLSPVSPTDFAVPSLEGLDVSRYLVWTKTYPLLTHTGCGFSCNFCTSVMPGPYQSKEVYRPVEDVIAEMRAALDAGFDHFFMSANIFTSRKSYGMKLCDELRRSKIADECTWVCMTRVEFVDNELLTAMRHAGCSNIAFGVETSGHTQWKKLGKGKFSKDTISRAFDLVKQAGITTTAFFMLGEPFQTQEDIEATVKLTRELNPDFRVVSFFQPFPGTPYWESPGKFGLSEIDPLEEWNFHEAPICRTQHLDKDELMSAAIRLYLDRGDIVPIAPSVHSLKRVVDPSTIYSDIPVAARAAFTHLDESTPPQDVLKRVAAEYGNRGRLVAMYWLSAALRDGVLKIANQRELMLCP